MLWQKIFLIFAKTIIFGSLHQSAKETGIVCICHSAGQLQYFC
ncbi:hypothetical protein OIU77_020963, partial [Salix suchowensis]